MEKSAIVILQGLTKLRQLANHPGLVEEAYTFDSGKFDEVIRNVETLISENHKVLMFSSFVKHLDLFASYFDENKIGYSRLTGETRHRAEVIEEFQTQDNRNVFLISIKAGGVGLNLTQAGYVFLLDPWWNPAVENQAVNRAHRIGQDKHVFAYRFITLDTIEEKIMRLQQKKSKLAEIFIHSDNPLNNLSVKNISELMD
jgi:SNF2 family DNA or RNA helicase